MRQRFAYLALSVALVGTLYLAYRLAIAFAMVMEFNR